MINKFYQNSNIEKFIVIIFPLLLITGPALPDITAVLLGIYFLLFKIKKNFKQIIKSYWIISFFVLWLWFLIISFFAYNQMFSFSDGFVISASSDSDDISEPALSSSIGEPFVSGPA